ncbi:Radical SAM domain protein [Methanothermus fervidus DSM 2088]|uniref:Radical SAM domain protein n=1 Tax=Methanothermus fervidus (strain ATCC 43054 / DSM 2088 / JCM 10308 / V24 S) TaxID=523846 RepID=E3GVZ0_METFV|nr:AmmeMemoRadiSam system radical SAM enzyme [Methanothermus fervidus]ADP77755.1 Radical SAM domain protein [Methanothermus fervidus DSM 2088]
MIKEAYLYEKINKKVRCNVCMRKCLIPPNKKGFCGTRENKDGKLYTLIYSTVSSVAIDPIEKKPLFHFYPGENVYSLGTVGCNFRCKHCQNWTISQEWQSVATEEISPEEAIQAAKNYNCKMIAWTYNEPTIWFEYTLDSAKIAKENGIKTVYVTNGYMSKEAFKKIKPFLDAANIDLKAMSDKFYREICGVPSVDPVLENIVRWKKAGVHIEVTNLIIPKYNDSKEMIRELIEFMVEEVGVDTPLHFTRFFPHYKLSDLPPTYVDTLVKAREMALKMGMRYVYIGNVPGTEFENTYCYECGELLIERRGFGVSKINLDDKACPKCGAKIDIIL